MNEKTNVQDQFLNAVFTQKISVTVFLMNGIKLQGHVSGFDNSSIMLRRENHSQLIYKHAISTIMPATLINENLDNTIQKDVE